MNQVHWDRACALHGHECPGLAIGVRASEAAMGRLGLAEASADEEVVCVTENDACCVDAVQAILGCTFGKGNLIYRGTGKLAFSFWNRRDGKCLRVYFKATKPDSMSPGDYQTHILDAPLGELFDFSEPSFPMPQEARLFASVTCAQCGERAPEHRMRMQGGKMVCMDCFQDYSRGHQ
ncbi:MAG: FmdE family protein [Clostridiales Family XIII bacterium]|jgi:formylmethanofuran dehydrogenase subunit E|nr:FmdE family protein [Clostridiales Family XIII bacterium]